LVPPAAVSGGPGLLKFESDENAPAQRHDRALREVAAQQRIFSFRKVQRACGERRLPMLRSSRCRQRPRSHCRIVTRSTNRDGVRSDGRIEFDSETVIDNRGRCQGSSTDGKARVFQGIARMKLSLLDVSLNLDAAADSRA
jgi:hypothetical protein